MPNISAFVLALTLLAASSSSAQVERSYFNPGIKFGKVIGAGEGIAIGIELSYSWWLRNDPIVAGAVFGVDYMTTGRWHVHAGMEAWSFLGLEIGPSVFIDSHGVHPGLGLTAYALGVVCPFYSYVFLPNLSDQQSFGLFLKYPMLIHQQPIIVY
jgi:hypothetical protein